MPERDRREFIRVTFSIRTTVRTTERTIWSTSTLDISLNGLRMATTEAPLPEGAACEVEIALADARPAVIIEARGTVVRSSPGMIAVNFTEIELDSYHHLRQLIVNNADDPARAEQEFDAHWGIRPARRPAGS